MIAASDGEVRKLALAFGQDVKRIDQRLGEIPADPVSAGDLLAAVEQANAGFDPSLQVSGTFLPTLAFATPGNSTITYTAQTGRFLKLDTHVSFAANVTATVSKGTASGRLRLGFSDIPFLPAGSLGGGQMRIKPAQIKIPSGAIALVPTIPPGSRHVEFGTYTAEAGTSTFISDAHVVDGAMTIAVICDYWL